MKETGKEEDLRRASVSFRVSPKLKKRLEREAERESKSLSDFLHSLISDALAMRHAGELPPAEQKSIDPALVEKLDMILRVMSEAEKEVRKLPQPADLLDEIESRQRRLTEVVTEDIGELRKGLRTALANFVRLAYPKLEDAQVTRMVNEAFET